MVRIYRSFCLVSLLTSRRVASGGGVLGIVSCYFVAAGWLVWVTLIYSVLVLPELPELGSQREEDFYINLFTFIRYTQQEKKGGKIILHYVFLFDTHLFVNEEIV